MNMNMSYVAGILVGILIAVILVKLFARKLHTNGEKKKIATMNVSLF